MLLSPYKPSVLLWEISKHKKPRSDATTRGISSGSTMLCYKIVIKLKNTTNTPLKDNAPAQLIKVGNSIRYKCVKYIIFIVMLCVIYYRFREACMF